MSRRYLRARVIIELIDSRGGLGFVQNRPRGGKRFQDSAMVSCQKDRQILHIHHNKPLYITAYVHELEFRHALVAPSFSLNVCLDHTQGGGDSSRHNRRATN